MIKSALRGSKQGCVHMNEENMERIETPEAEAPAEEIIPEVEETPVVEDAPAEEAPAAE